MESFCREGERLGFTSEGSVDEWGVTAKKQGGSRFSRKLPRGTFGCKEGAGEAGPAGFSLKAGGMIRHTLPVGDEELLNAESSGRRRRDPC